MSKLMLIAGGSTGVYACLAVLMGVLPGIDQSRVPPGPGVLPLSALEAEGRAFYYTKVDTGSVKVVSFNGSPFAPGKPLALTTTLRAPASTPTLMAAWLSDHL